MKTCTCHILSSNKMMSMTAAANIQQISESWKLSARYSSFVPRYIVFYIYYLWNVEKYFAQNCIHYNISKVAASLK